MLISSPPERMQCFLTLLKDVSLNHRNVTGRKQKGLILQNNTFIFSSCSPVCMKFPSEKKAYAECIRQFQTTPQTTTFKQREKKSEACNCAICKSLLDQSPSLWFGNTTNTSLFSSLEEKKKPNREKNTLKIKVMINPSGTKRIVLGISGSNSSFQINSSKRGIMISPQEDQSHRL